MNKKLWCFGVWVWKWADDDLEFGYGLHGTKTKYIITERNIMTEMKKIKSMNWKF